MAQEDKISIFGTSAGYISALMAERASGEGVRPGRSQAGSFDRFAPSEEAFEFIYREAKNDIQLSSISGGFRH